MNLRPVFGRSSTWAAAAVYQRGLAAFETAQYAEAIDLLGQVHEERSLSGTLATFYLSQAHLRFGLSELRAGRYTLAAPHLVEARRLNPESAGLTEHLARCFAVQGRFDLLAAELERADARTAADQNLPIRLAHALARDGRMDRAVETLEQAIHNAPQRPDLHNQLGLLLASADDPAGAIDHFQTAARLAPWDPAVLQNLGLAYAAADRHAEAIEPLALAHRLRPADAYLALLLTLALESVGARADETDLTPIACPNSRKEQAALDALGDLIAEEPDFVEAFLSLPESRVDTEVFAMLAATIERSLERHSEYADLHHHCSRVYTRLGRSESAVAAAQNAVRLNPRYVQALIQLARAYAATDRGDEAIDRLNDAIDCGGDYPDVHFMLGELYRGRGDEHRACVEYVRALRRNANYEKARGALLELVAA